MPPAGRQKLFCLRKTISSLRTMHRSIPGNSHSIFEFSLVEALRLDDSGVLRDYACGLAFAGVWHIGIYQCAESDNGVFMRLRIRLRALVFGAVDIQIMNVVGERYEQLLHKLRQAGAR